MKSLAYKAYHFAKRKLEMTFAILAAVQLLLMYMYKNMGKSFSSIKEAIRQHFSLIMLFMVLKSANALMARISKPSPLFRITILLPVSDQNYVKSQFIKNLCLPQQHLWTQGALTKLTVKQTAWKHKLIEIFIYQNVIRFVSH